MLDIILLAMLAGFIILRLRSELGKKTGNEPLPPAAPRSSAQTGRPSSREDATQDIPGREDNVVELEENPALRKAYQDIRRVDSSFDVPTFMEGASAAYEMILEAFWAGDRETLKGFLDDSVYQQFSSALDAREENGYKVENKLIDVANAEITKAQLQNRMAELTVHFTAEIIAVTKDADGNLVEGDLSDAVEVNDRWTFARDTRSRDPNWTLVATRAG
ncbi:Tim44/TimA family putative adaptor protein [Kordiimonas aestuarii]|uniref:Tim44/TimA family putative adaptor protein n=1 Tax=Kordiimonas aestuarii TaxID=1005925 RepID=UPI0021CE43FB|nr:Tim44/TimA family putative adaptor protein [Kordiimonas aestuarii]